MGMVKIFACALCACHPTSDMLPTALVCECVLLQEHAECLPTTLRHMKNTKGALLLTFVVCVNQPTLQYTTHLADSLHCTCCNSISPYKVETDLSARIKVVLEEHY